MKKVLLALITIAFISCEKEENPSVGKPANVKSINITEADYLAIGQQGLKSTTNGWSNLYKLSIEGSGLKSEKVGFLDGNGGAIDSIFTTIQIDNLYTVSLDYICLVGNFEIQVDSSIEKLIYSSLLVNKTNGEVFDFNGHYPENKSYYLGRRYLQSDNNQNFYYKYQSGIYKLDLSNAQASYETYVSNSQYNGDNFFVSPNSACYFYGYPNAKIKTSENGIILADRYLKNYFTGADNKDYCVLNHEIGQIDVIGDNFSYSKIGEIATLYDNEIYSFNYNTDSSSLMLMDRIGDNNIIGDIFFFNPFEAFSVQLPSELTNDYKIVDIVAGKIVITTNNNTGKKFHLFNLNSLYKSDEKTYLVSEYESLECPPTYEVYEYTMLENGDIGFIGYDLSGENDISGVLTANNEMIINEVSSDYQFEILQKLN